MDYNIFITEAMDSYISSKEDVRYGQHLMNTLTKLAPDVANTVPEELDPYYNSEKAPEFLNYLWNYWENLNNIENLFK